MKRRRPLSQLVAIGAVLVAACVALSSCRTMEGFGEDLSHLGAKISGKAREKGA
ncbi:MAG TPA: entericidin A/B family lipoprotein [Stellaceae bacterium]|jgi:predicted small secreted protein